MTAQTTPLAGAPDADRVREAIIDTLQRRAPLEDEVATDLAYHITIGPLSDLLADREALRTRAEAAERERDDARCVGEATARAADANLEACEAAEARVEELQGLLVTQEICAEKLTAELAALRSAGTSRAEAEAMREAAAQAVEAHSYKGQGTEDRNDLIGMFARGQMRCKAAVAKKIRAIPLQTTGGGDA